MVGLHNRADSACECRDGSAHERRDDGKRERGDGNTCRQEGNGTRERGDNGTCEHGGDDCTCQHSDSDVYRHGFHTRNTRIQSLCVGGTDFCRDRHSQALGKAHCRRWQHPRGDMSVRLVGEAESGMVSVLMAAAMVIAVVMVAVLMQLSAQLAQKERLQNGADLAALGAATKYVAGSSLEDSCAVASFIVADLHDQPQLECEAQGDNIRIDIEVTGKFAWISPAVRVHAVAGPV